MNVLGSREGPGLRAAARFFQHSWRRFEPIPRVVNDGRSRTPQRAADLTAAGIGSSLTYEPFFGLHEKPFSLSADPRFLFKSPSHGQVFDALLGGIRRREGIIALTGEIGTGKTTLCRAVLQALDRRTFASFVTDPFVSRVDLLKMLLVDFGVISIGDLKHGRLRGASRSDLSYLLNEFLDSLVPLQAFAVIVLDEAQHLPVPLLEEIRILAELERREKLLEVVLVGQPELRASLRLPHMRQLDQRVSVRCELPALDADGVAAYVSHRLAVAGRGAPPVEFPPEALDALYLASSGVPRLINRICDRALERAFSARSHTIDPCFVRDAIGDAALDVPLDGREPASHRIAAAARDTRRVIPASAARHESGAPPALPAPPAASISTRANAVPAFDEPGPGTSARHAAARARRSRDGRAWFAAAIASSLALASTAAAGAWYVGSVTIEHQVLASMLPARPPAAFVRSVLVASVAEDEGTTIRVNGAAPRSSIPAVDGGYAIEVASFDSRARAERLAEELRAGGYRAREVEIDLGTPRGRLVQVIVDGYSSALHVERDLRRIRELPGYSSARLLEP